MSQDQKPVVPAPQPAIQAPRMPERPRREQSMPLGHYSNQQIIRRNGGIRPRFVDDIGGCSENYR